MHFQHMHDLPFEPKPFNHAAINLFFWHMNNINQQDWRQKEGRTYQMDIQTRNSKINRQHHGLLLLSTWPICFLICLNNYLRFSKSRSFVSNVLAIFAILWIWSYNFLTNSIIQILFEMSQHSLLHRLTNYENFE